MNNTDKKEISYTKYINDRITDPYFENNANIDSENSKRLANIKI